MSQSDPGAPGEKRGEHLVPAQFPDERTCRVKRSGSLDFLQCLNQWAWKCHHALPFGEATFCRHPSRLDILSRSNLSEDSAETG